MEHEEYTRDNYPTSGKKYNGEKAIISLTSWRARINTVDKTIYSLIKQCPGFHIVLVLSEEEFPKREEELPERLMLFVENELIELLWVYKNYKSFKKVLFTMDKYRDIPVISADDDCIYTCNYAEMLYQKWCKHKSYQIITATSCKVKDFTVPYGYATLYTPKIFNFQKIKKSFDVCLEKNILHEDLIYAIYGFETLKILSLNKKISAIAKASIDNRTNSNYVLLKSIPLNFQIETIMASIHEYNK